MVIDLHEDCRPQKKEEVVIIPWGNGTEAQDSSPDFRKWVGLKFSKGIYALQYVHPSSTAKTTEWPWNFNIATREYLQQIVTFLRLPSWLSGRIYWFHLSMQEI